MKCKTCGFAASDAGLTVCPFCQAKAEGSAAVMTASAVWPPAPTAAPTYSLSGYPGADAIQKQRQAGILMALLPLAVVQAAASFSNFLPAHYGTVLLLVVLLGGAYPHFRGCAHWAESKGYPRYEGRLLGILGWLGVLFLAIRRDKTPAPV